MGRDCIICHKEFKNARGLRRHRFYCLPLGVTICQQCGKAGCRNDTSCVPIQSYPLDEDMYLGQEVDDVGEAIPNQDVLNESYLSGLMLDDVRLLDFDNATDSQPVSSWSRATVSSGGATTIDTYLEVEGGPLPPGYVYPESTYHSTHTHTDDNSTAASTPRLYSCTPDETDPQLFFPFRDRQEYRLGWWLFRTRQSNAEMNDLFAIGGLWSELSLIRSVKIWRQTLYQIPYGIQNDSITEQDITVLIPGSNEALKYTVRYRSILSVIRFLISFPPFAPNLAYAPIRLYKDEERSTQIWNEMWTGSWWWDQQRSLPPGSTLIPVLLASDKTQLTQHHGDKSSHPVYVTIGNLDKKTRRAQTRPSKILLGFLPIVNKNHHRLTGEKSYTYRRTVINKAMAVMLRELQITKAEGLRLRCADGQIRHCYPVIAGFSLDYEEQAFLAGVKSGQHCVTCRVPPDSREKLMPLERYPLRDHQYSQDLIKHVRGLDSTHDQDAREDSVDSTQAMYTKQMWIDDVVSFMWSFQRANIHEIMHVDILHQCFKGVVHRSLNDWVLAALQRQYGNARAATIMDDRFRAIPAFPNLKRFPSYSNISQWTGVEQKALLRQVVPALAPILPPAMTQFVRAVVDFTLHAQYYSHDGDTLSWMEAALARMDVLKESFRDYTTPGAGFNIPKLHAITHYPMMIRKFGSADGYDTAMFEAGHKYIIKDWYPLTNKRASFELQIFEHNQRAVNMLAMHDLVQFRFPETTSRSEDDPAQNTAVSRSVDLDELGWVTNGPSEKIAIRRKMKELPARKELPYIQRQPQYWRRACTIAQIVGQPGFLDALAVFVREERRRARGEISSDIAINMREPDPAWIDNYLLCVHPSLSCWKSERDDGTNADVRVRELVRCDPNWQGKGEWRRDCVWVQEYPNVADRHRPLQGRLPARLLVIVSVLDVELSQQQQSPSIFTGAFLDVYSLRDQGRQNRTHGMIEAQRHPVLFNEDRRTLGHRRFYRLGLILRSVHLVAASVQEGDTFYINSYADWDQYTTVFDPDFLAKDAAVVQRIAKQHGWVYRS